MEKSSTHKNSVLPYFHVCCCNKYPDERRFIWITILISWSFLRHQGHRVRVHLSFLWVWLLMWCDCTMWLPALMSQKCLWKSEDNLQELILSFYHESWESSIGHQAWWQASLVCKPSGHPPCWFYLFVTQYWQLHTCKSQRTTCMNQFFYQVGYGLWTQVISHGIQSPDLMSILIPHYGHLLCEL